MRIFLNRFTLRFCKKLQRFLNANIAESAFTRAQTKIVRLQEELEASEVAMHSLRVENQTKQVEAVEVRQKLRRTRQQLQSARQQLLNAKQQLQSARQQLLNAKQQTQSARKQLLNAQDRWRDEYKQRRAIMQRSDQLQKRIREWQGRYKLQATELKRAQPAKGVLKAILQGASSEHALLLAVRGKAGQPERAAARSIGFQMYNQPDTRAFGAMLLGIFMYHEEMYASAVGYFSELDRTDVLGVASCEYFGAWVAHDVDIGRAKLRDYIKIHRASLTALEAYQLCAVLAKFRLYDDLHDAFTTINSLVAPPVDTDLSILEKIDWMKARVAQTPSSPPWINDDQINLAIMDYKLLDRSRTSSNRGDYVQTLASLANICRFQNVTFAGDTALSRQLEELKADIQEDRRLDGPKATVVPVALDRDFASGRTYLPNTWLICNGWFMHRNFRGLIDFPFPQTVNPIFISFHINDPDVLTSEAVAELRKYEPIGCRDWTTIYRLKDFGISCFFSGCLTTSIGQILPRADNLPKRKLAAVETSVDIEDYENWEMTDLSQIGDHVRDFSLTDGIQDAKDMLISYLDYSKIQTSRLHCYLPCRSMGFEVDFQPKNRSDIRFEGLLELNEETFGAIRKGIETKLETILGAIFEGQPKEDVLELWREICAPDVAAADAYFNAPLPANSVVDVPTVLGDVIRQIPRPLHNNAIEVALALDENLKSYLPAVLHSVAAHASRSINVHLIYRGLDQNYLNTLTEAFPDISFQLMDFSKVDYGSELRLLSHTTQSTLDRLYLPELLEDIDKVAYLDIDLLVRADLAEIFDVDLCGYVLAGKFSNLPSWQNVVRLMSRASLKLSPEDAWMMRRRLHREIQMPARTFNAGVIVMNLSLMRDENFTSKNLYLVTDCYCNDQDALNIYAAGRVKEIPVAWNYVVAQDYDLDPKLIHWAGSIKPWHHSMPTLWADEFHNAMVEGWRKMEVVAESQI